MALVPFPTQIEGARFLANRRYALLADAPRVGKTGAAIMACDFNLDRSILVVTTASGRAVWRKAWTDWSAMGRSVQVMTKAVPATGDVVIVGWPQIADNKFRAELLKRRWDRLILDEAHNAKNFEARRTQAAYGRITYEGEYLSYAGTLRRAADSVWCLTGTPLPNSPFDAFPMMLALCPERLKAQNGWPAVDRETSFRDRYCVTRFKKISNFRKIPVIVGGRNEDELRARLDGFMLLRTQKDVGIREPIHDLLPLAISNAQRREIDNVDQTAVLNAIDAGDTKALEMHLGPLRRLTGAIKAKAVVEAAIDEFDGGLDKIVLAYWHREVGDILAEGLRGLGVSRIDGETTPKEREAAQALFASRNGTRVMLAQIAAAGEAIDLSAAAVLWFVETTFAPSQMKQMSLRVTNYTQMRQVFVKVCTLEGSIDEALQASLFRKWSSIREVLKQDA